jgi:hypothetical protein
MLPWLKWQQANILKTEPYPKTCFVVQAKQGKFAIILGIKQRPEILRIRRTPATNNK